MPPDPLVILTQEAPDSEALAEQLAPLGITALIYPCLATRYLAFDPAEPIAGRLLRDYSVIAVTSRRGAVGLAQAGRVLATGVPLIACVGPATAQAVEAHLGRKCEMMPAMEQTGEGLARLIAATIHPPGAVLHVRGNLTSGTLTAQLAAVGWSVAELVVYENYAPAMTPLGVTGPAVAAFASPSAASRFRTCMAWSTRQAGGPYVPSALPVR